MSKRILATTTFASFCIIILILSITSSCKKTNNAGSSKDTAKTVTCTVPGTYANMGSLQPNAYYLDLTGNSVYYLGFVNANLTFSIEDNSGLPCYIIDVGAQSCPNFTYTGIPSSYTALYKKGDGYFGKFGDGHTVKFVAGSFNVGVVSLNYIFL